MIPSSVPARRALLMNCACLVAISLLPRRAAAQVTQPGAEGMESQQVASPPSEGPSPDARALAIATQCYAARCHANAQRLTGPLLQAAQLQAALAYARARRLADVAVGRNADA